MEPKPWCCLPHGSGSSRHSPRNNLVASALRDAGIGTLLLDLLTEREAADRANVFDIAFLARRLGDATRWIRNDQDTKGLRIGYFGASTGAAAALVAAAHDPSVRAIVSRGGRISRRPCCRRRKRRHCSSSAATTCR